MSKMTYKCDLCEHDFKQKVDLDESIIKKTELKYYLIWNSVFTLR